MIHVISIVYVMIVHQHSDSWQHSNPEGSQVISQCVPRHKHSGRQPSQVLLRMNGNTEIISPSTWVWVPSSWRARAHTPHNTPSPQRTPGNTSHPSVYQRTATGAWWWVLGRGAHDNAPQWCQVPCSHSRCWLPVLVKRFTTSSFLSFLSSHMQKKCVSFQNLYICLVTMRTKENKKARKVWKECFWTLKPYHLPSLLVKLFNLLLKLSSVSALIKTLIVEFVPRTHYHAETPLS